MAKRSLNTEHCNNHAVCGPTPNAPLSPPIPGGGRKREKPEYYKHCNDHAESCPSQDCSTACPRYDSTSICGHIKQDELDCRLWPTPNAPQSSVILGAVVAVTPKMREHSKDRRCGDAVVPVLVYISVGGRRQIVTAPWIQRLCR